MLRALSLYCSDSTSGGGILQSSDGNTKQTPTMTKPSEGICYTGPILRKRVGTGGYRSSAARRSDFAPVPPSLRKKGADPGPPSFGTGWRILEGTSEYKTRIELRPRAEKRLKARVVCSPGLRKGAYPGYAGELLVDPATGASYNVNGAHGRKYLVPALFDPSTASCSTMV
ncbi:uncharacterized protein A4U43_C03F2810 [Asparagus officinalis]|uniref:Uncharacterized protein n=1 Tax=Asparagus officinalis TaxID=4686 RepID=A0A5P1F7K6_ASPOF|nr:uncharacterized protein A4U43_C03F2810 [Asparagus officinalis]